MKKKITTRKNGTRRVQLDCSKPILTDQSMKNSTDINAMMRQYQKTGIPPQLKQKVGDYRDNVGMPTLEEAHDQVEYAKNLFYELPAAIRRRMNNDPTKLPAFMQDTDNHELLVKHGLLEKTSVEGDVNPSQAPRSPKGEETSPEESEASE